MNSVLLSIILIPILEIYLFIKIGSQIGAFNTILLIFVTAIIGIYYAKYEGLNNIRSGFSQIFKNRFLTKINRNFYVVFQCISQISSFLQKIVQNNGNFKRSKTSTFTKRQKLRPVPIKIWNSQLHIGERIFSIGSIFFTFAGSFKVP